MSESSDQLFTEVENRLDAASRLLSRLDILDTAQAERVGQWIDRVTSQLHELTPPPRSTGPVPR